MSRQQRVNEAIHLYYGKGMTQQEIADELGVHQGTVSSYLNEDIVDEVEETVRRMQGQVIEASLSELRAEIRELHEQLEDVKVDAREAEVAVRFYTDEDGSLVTQSSDDGGIEKIAQGFHWEPDEKTRYFRRSEWREIRDQIREVHQTMRELVDVDSAQKIEVSGSVDHSVDDVEEKIDDMDFQI